MHVYESDLRSLYERQPDNLTHLERLLRIDRLSCIDAEIKLELNSQTDVEWFYVLSTLLTALYDPEVLKTFEHIKDIVRGHAERYTSSIRDGSALNDTQETLQYIQYRQQLIQHVRLNHSDRPR